MSLRAANMDAGMSSRLMNTVRNNPEGLLLLAAGCALLMRSGSTRRQQSMWYERQPSRADIEAARNRRDWADQQGSWLQQKGGAVADTMAQTAESVSDYGADVAGRVSEATSSVASSVSDYASQTGRSIAEGSSRMARQAQSGLDRFIEDQPLALPLVGLAAGAALAALFPATEMEKQTLGPAGERMTEAAGEAGRRLKEAAGKAEQRIEEEMEERGLNKEGLKEAASEVADTFRSALSGEDSEKQAAGPQSGRAATPGGGDIAAQGSGRQQASSVPAQPRNAPPTVAAKPGQS